MIITNFQYNLEEVIESSIKFKFNFKFFHCTVQKT